MDILSRIESIFKVDLSSLKKLQNKIVINIQVNSENKTVINHGTIINIDPTGLSRYVAK